MIEILKLYLKLFVTIKSSFEIRNSSLDISIHIPNPYLVELIKFPKILKIPIEFLKEFFLKVRN